MIKRSPSSRFWTSDFPVRPAGTPFFYGWVVAFLATIGICASMPGQTIGVGVFKTRLMEALGLTSMQLSVAYMIGTFLSALFLNAGGRFFDRAGARKAIVYSLAALGFVLLGLSAIDKIAALAGKLPFLSTYVWLPAFLVLTIGFCFLRFTGQGMLTMTSRAMLGKWFNRRRGLVTAWSGALVSFMFSGAPICFEYLIRQFSWQGAWFIMAIFMLLVLVPLFWVFARDNPEECGLVMDGGHIGKVRKANPDSTIYRDYTRAEAVRSFSFWAFTLMFALSGLVITAYAFHIIALGDEIGVSSDYILKLFIPSACISILTGMTVAWMTDLSFVRIKYLLTLMGLAGASAYACIGLGHYPSISWLHVISLGISGGCFGSLSTIVFPRFYGRQHLGAISGVFMTTIVIASAVGPFLFSLSDLLLANYRIAFVMSAAFAVALAIAALWADNPQRDLADEVPN